MSYAFNSWSGTADHESMSTRQKSLFSLPSHLLIREGELDERPGASPSYTAHPGIGPQN